MMRKQVTITGKVQEVSSKILNLEKQITEVESNDKNADSIKDKIFFLERKLGLFRGVHTKLSFRRLLLWNR